MAFISKISIINKTISNIHEYATATPSYNHQINISIYIYQHRKTRRHISAARRNRGHNLATLTQTIREFANMARIMSAKKTKQPYIVSLFSIKVQT